MNLGSRFDTALMTPGLLESHRETISRYLPRIGHISHTCQAPFPLHISATGAGKVPETCPKGARNLFFIP